MEQTIHILQDKAVTRNDSIQITINRERSRLRNYIRQKVSNRADAEDILQDVFYQFISVMQLDNIEKAASWLFRVAGNRITDFYRKRKTISIERQKEIQSGDDADTALMHEDIPFEPGEDPEKSYLRSEVWTLLDEALQELPDEQREVFVMHELDDISYKEIAEITGVSVNTLITRKHYAVLFIRKKLRDFYSEFLND